MKASWVRDFLLAWAAVFLISASWALATPLAGSPDEPSHIIKAAAVVRGEFIGAPAGRPSWTIVQVPVGVADAQSWSQCFAFHPDVTAACSEDPPIGLELAPAWTSAGLYNPVYYALVGWPTLFIDHGGAAVVAMRLVSAALSSALLAVTIVMLRSFGRPKIALIGTLVAMTPMLFFLNGAVNPNSLEVSGAAAVLAVLLRCGLGAPPGQRFAVLAAIIAVAGALTVSARAVSALWLAACILIAILATPPGRLLELARRPATWVAAAFIAGATAFSAIWAFSTNTLSNLGTFDGAGTVGPVRGFWEMLLDRSFDAGIIGDFGWLDTPAPALVIVVWAALFLLLVVAACSVARGRMLAAVVASALVMLLVPPLVQAASVTTSGYIWQGRYTLVAYVAVVVVATIAVSTSTGWRVQGITGGVVWAFGGLIAAAQAAAIAQLLRRFMSGTSTDWIDVLRVQQWSPPLGPVPWLAGVIVGSLLLTWMTARSGAAHRRPAEAPADAPRIGR